MIDNQALIDRIVSELNCPTGRDVCSGCRDMAAAIIAIIRAETPIPDKTNASDNGESIGYGKPVPAEVGKASEILDDFDPIEARKDLTDRDHEILKRPIVQSLLYDLNLLPEQITQGKHWFYMRSVIAHMDQASITQNMNALEIAFKAGGRSALAAAVVAYVE